MILNKLFGERCVRCHGPRTKKSYEGRPTCEKCQLEIQAERENSRSCPVCNCPMNKAVVLDVILDKCTSCGGAWLDAGELERLRQTLEAKLGGDSGTGPIMSKLIG